MSCPWPIDYFVVGFCSGGLLSWLLVSRYDRKLTKIEYNNDSSEEEISKNSSEEDTSVDSPKDLKIKELNNMLENELLTRSSENEDSRSPIPNRGGYKSLESNDMEIRKRRMDIALSIAEEKDVINSFRNIVGMYYYEAVTQVKERGYNLHPIYILANSKMPAASYSTKVLGVRIRDPDFNETNKMPSLKAVITEIIDVGGIDVRDVGIIKL